VDVKSNVPPPTHRRLRVYSFDPSLATQLETALVNQATIKVPWEELGLGPVGEYLEVVDYDPPSGCFYDPVDLNAGSLLAQDGLAPSEGNPQFHQQMVYAVAMRTIRNFELALGRLALWSPRRLTEQHGATKDEFVQRLRIYPHAMREANAYYSPEKKALLFGYFPASMRSPGDNLPGGIVFTCLSHDIIAHETTHALLDGRHVRFTEASNPDVLAFHEAFADIVALFQHFSLPEVLHHQIAKTHGDLESQSLLGQLAQQFGQATGHYGALRSAIGRINPENGKWELLRPDPTAYANTLEPHDRGALLVATIFDAFLAIYRSRIADLLRIATGGTGILQAGEIHPDLVNRLADEAAKAAQRVLTICIRALDYCPPVDITFGDYLRALITADSNAVPEDEHGYRVAFIEAFRRRGIYPHDVRTLSEDSLRWLGPTDDPQHEVNFQFAKQLSADEKKWRLSRKRSELFEGVEKTRIQLHQFLDKGLSADPEVLQRIDRNLPFEVDSLRPTMRTGPGGERLSQWIIEITQSRKEYLDEQPGPAGENFDESRPHFTFRGGCTWIVDTDTGRVRYAIEKRMGSKARLERQRRFLKKADGRSLRAMYFGSLGLSGTPEPFSLLHRDFEERQVTR
jgi:hypothetical protein